MKRLGLTLATDLALIFAMPVQAQSSFGPAIDIARTYTVQIKVTGKREDKDTSPILGTGVIVRTDGYIATAAHVVGKDAEWLGENDVLQRTISVRLPDEHGVLETDNWRSAVLVTEDSENDVALLKVEGDSFRRADCGVLPDDFGWPIYSLGFPVRALPGKAFKPNYAETLGGQTSTADKPTNFLGNMVSAKGMSGGPAIDSAGAVVGIAVEREDAPQGRAFSYTEFVRIADALRLLPAEHDERSCHVPRIELTTSIWGGFEKQLEWTHSFNYSRSDDDCEASYDEPKEFCAPDGYQLYPDRFAELERVSANCNSQIADPTLVNDRCVSVSSHLGGCGYDDFGIARNCRGRGFFEYNVTLNAERLDRVDIPRERFSADVIDDGSAKQFVFENSRRESSPAASEWHFNVTIDEYEGLVRRGHIELSDSKPSESGYSAAVGDGRLTIQKAPRADRISRGK